VEGSQVKKSYARFYFFFLILLPIFILTATVVYAATWDVQNDFSGTSNPAGAWSYGWESAPGQAFTLYNAPIIGWEGSTVWHDSNITAWDNTPGVWKNIGQDPTNNVQPGEVSLHPGQPAGQYSVVRWTSPVAGTISIAGKFGAGDSGMMSYYIYDGTTSLLKVQNSYADAPFSFTESVSIGSTIDFLIGESYWYGNTPLYATISNSASVPEPSAMLLLGLGLMGLAGVRNRFSN
jgi:hypothetical protein